MLLVRHAAQCAPCRSRVVRSELAPCGKRPSMGDNKIPLLRSAGESLVSDFATTRSSDLVDHQRYHRQRQ